MAAKDSLLLLNMPSMLTPHPPKNSLPSLLPPLLISSLSLSPQFVYGHLRLKIFGQVPAREPSPVCMIELA